MPPKIVVVGSANTDMVVKLTALPRPGQTLLGGEFVSVQGGKGANQAVAAARLGAEVTFVARLGRDPLGQAAAQAYASDRICLDYLAWDDAAPSGVALIMVGASGENMIAVAPGANGRLSPEDVLRAEPAIRQANAMLLQLEIPFDTVQAAAQLAKRHGVRVILNPAPAATLPAELYRFVDILTPNESEAAALSPGEFPAPEDLAVRVQSVSGVKLILMTLGAQGALAATSEGTRRFPAFRVTPVDTVAAGDAFNGGLAVALGRGDPLEAAVRFASAAAALSVTRPGAQPSLPYLAEVENFLRTR